jgi:CMP-N-acetylneuraminic acid synthetase
MKSLGVIVARGSSKRVPRKVLRELAGHPVIAWMVRAALNSGLDRVILSTEDDEIAATAESYGADVPFRRSKALAQDETRNDAVLLDALNRIDSDGEYDAVVLLQSAAPFVRPDQIDACVSRLAEGKANCVFAARLVREPPDWMFEETPEGTAKRLLGGELIGGKQLSQSHRKVLMPAGSVWAVRTDALRLREAVYAPPLSMIEVPHECAVDLDEEVDFIVAEATAKHHRFTLPPLPDSRSA